MGVHYHYVGYGEGPTDWTIRKIKHEHHGNVDHYHGSHPSLDNVRDPVPVVDERVTSTRLKKTDSA